MPPKPRLSSPIHAIIMPSVRVLAATVLVISSGPAGAADVFLTDDQDSGEDWNTAAKWSDGAAPVAGNNYFTQGFLLRTPTVNSAAADFNGDRLTVGPGGTLLLANPHSGTTPPGDVTSVGDLVFEPGSFWEVNISGGDHGRLVLGGPTTLDLTNIGLATGVVPVAPLLDASTGYQILEILEGEVTGQFSNMTTGGPFAGSFPGADGFVDLSGIAFAVYLNAVLDGDGRVMDGGGIVLIASPEPGRAMLLAMAGLLVLGGRRRG